MPCPWPGRCDRAHRANQERSAQLGCLCASYGAIQASACRGEIIVYPVSTTSLVRDRAGAGEPLVLLHGVGESAAGWRPVQEALSRAYDVIALDFPGFGGSAKLPADALPNAVALADAVEREMDQLGIGDFHVAGYSLGARVSLELATRGRIRSAIAIAPDGLGTPPERVYQAATLMAGRALAILPRDGGPARWSVTFAVDDADATAARARELGGSVLAEPQDAPWVRFAVLADPAGASFTASQFVADNR